MNKWFKPWLGAVFVMAIWFSRELCFADTPLAAEVSPAFAGSESCRACHSSEYAAWAKSHHGLAERPLRPELDAAAFHSSRIFSQGSQTNRIFETNGVSSIFTTGSGGVSMAYPVVRVIGHDPLRQFLTSTTGGRFQVHEASYDPLKNEWFDVYGMEDRQPGEWGHWSGRGMNWNSMCAFCHNTGLQKNYSESTDEYHTAMAEPTVGCESCHGPMKAHVDWSLLHKGATEKDPTIRKLSAGQMLDTCAACHSRRSDLDGKFKPGDHYLDHFAPSIVDDSDTFYPDGQIHEEDYEVNAFWGSRMHFAGVKCADCHEPHSSKTILPGNALCMRCHAGGFTNAPIIDPVEHGHHLVAGYDSKGKPVPIEGSTARIGNDKLTGGECISCHMPQTVYMQRHWRHDHGFTIPDPRLTAEFGVPNACNRCHKDKDVAWASQAVEKWFGDKMNRPSRQRARWIARARQGRESAREPLMQLATTNETPFWRAVAAGLLEPWSEDAKVSSLLINLSRDTNAIVRAKAVQSLSHLAEQHAPGVEEVLRERLKDPLRMIRYEAGWALRETLETNSVVFREISESLAFNADQPAGQAQYAVWNLAHAELDSALAHYARAVQWDSNSPPFRIDYAVALSLAGQGSNALVQIQAACLLAPNDAENFFRLGLAWNEAGSAMEAIRAMEKAVRLNEHHDRALYNLGLLYNQQGDSGKAIRSLKQAEDANPRDPRSAYARATILAGLGRNAEAVEAAKKALQIQPDFTDARELIRSLTR